MKTKEEHILNGTYRPDRHDKQGGNALEELPEPPAHLSADEQETFTEVCERLQDNDALTRSDLFIVEAFAIQLNLMRQAKAEMEAAGKLVTMHTNKNGSTNPTASPWVSIIQKSGDQLLKLSAKLGLNPVDRAKQTKVLKQHDADAYSLFK